MILLALQLASPPAIAAQDPGCEVAPEWKGDAVDAAGTRWPWTLEIVQSGTGLTGVFVWRGSNGGGGEESVRGTIDCGSRAVILDGVSVDTTTIATAHYELALSEAFDRIEGTWTGPGPAGTMHGRRRR